MTDDQNLLRPLRIGLDDLPPSTVDLEAAVAAGRRQEHFRGAAALALTAVAVLATILLVSSELGGSDRTLPTFGPAGSPHPSVSTVPPHPRPSVSSNAPPEVPQPTQAATGCTPADLNVPGLLFGALTMDPQGRILVAVTGDAYDTITVVTDGHSQTRPAPATGANVPAVNSAGSMLIMTGYTGAYVDGAPLPIPPDADGTQGEALTDSGVALLDVERHDLWQAAMWPADHPSTLRFLDTPAGKQSRTAGMTDDGKAVGFISDPDGANSRPVYWTPDGKRHDLTVPGDATWLQPVDVAGDWAVSRDVRWNLKTGETDRIRGIDARAIDANGRVYGAVPLQGPQHPAYWQNGHLYGLPTSSPQELGVVSQASADGKRLLATLRVEANKNVNQRTVLYTCQ